MIRALDATTPQGAAPLAPLVASGARRSRLVVVTDLLGDAEATARGARLRCGRG